MADSPVGGQLVLGVERGQHHQAACVGLVSILGNHGLAHHFGHEFGVGSIRVDRRTQLERLGFRRLRLSHSDEAVFDHSVDDVQLPRPRALGIAHWVVGGRGLRQPGEHGGFGDRDVLK